MFFIFTECTVAVSLLRKIKEAVAESNDHKFLHHQFVLGLPADSVGRWEEQLSKWEEDHSKPNPFEKRFKGMCAFRLLIVSFYLHFLVPAITQDAVCKRLAFEEAQEMAAGTAYVLHEEISASQLITMGLDFEEQQYVTTPVFSIVAMSDAYSERRRLAVDLCSLGPHSTDEQKTRLQIRCNVLRRKITSWINVEHLYIPALHVLRTRDDQSLHSNEQEEEVSKIKLYLPSSITSTYTVCDIRLRRIEWDLRQAQAHDALHELRDSLRLRSYVYINKDRFQRGQRYNTRSRGLVNRLETKVKAAAAKYRAARQAISVLASPLGHVGWETGFPALNDSNITGLTDMSLPEYYKALHTSRCSQVGTGSHPSEGHRDVSWIWKRLGNVENSDEQLQDGMCRTFSFSYSLTQIHQTFGSNSARVRHVQIVGQRR